MGTNYYLHRDKCAHCGRYDDALHIGKSSRGWCFALRVDVSIGISSLADWQKLWDMPNAKIVDEYGKELTAQEMLKEITDREWHTRAPPRGPNGLSRHRVDGHHCIGHGDGTYDLITGEFS